MKDKFFIFVQSNPGGYYIDNEVVTAYENPIKSK